MLLLRIFYFKIFCFELIFFFFALTNKKLSLSLYGRLKQKFLFDLEKLIEYWVSADNVASSNPFLDLYQKLKWLLGLRKLRALKKVEILQIGLILRIVWWENIIFYYERKKQRFFLIFTMKLFSTALSYLTAQSTLSFTWTSLYF